MRASSTLDMNTSSLYTAAADSSPSSIDSRKSASDLVQDGTFIQSNRTPRLDQTERTAGEQPKVIVSNDATVTPDYVVRKDGKIEVVGNPDAGDKAHSVYRVQVEEGADQKNTDALVKYLNERIHQKEPSAEVGLSAAPGLVSDEVSKLFNTTKPDDNKDPQDNPPDDNPPSDDDNSPSDPGGDCPGPGPSPDNSPDDSPSPDDNPQDNPPDTPPQPDALPQLSGPMDGLLDAARLNNWDNNTLGALGAYEINAPGWFSSWLDDEMMGELEEIDPKTGKKVVNFKNLGKVLAKHKNDPKFMNAMNSRLNNMREQGDTTGADKIESLFKRLGDEKDSSFAENFGIFLNSQRPGGRNATGEEMSSLFDKDLQKAIASSRMADIAHDARVKIKDLPPDQAAKMALAGALGHIPSEKEISDYNKYLQVVASKYKPNKTTA